MDEYIVGIDENEVEAEIYSAKYDIIFKRLFIDEGRNDCLPAFLSAFTGIPVEEMGEIEITNSELMPDEFDGKVSRLDLALKFSGRAANIEIQLPRRAGFVDRALFYSAKMVGGSLKKGQAYSELPSVISLNIIDYKLFNDDSRKNKYHTVYRLTEADSHEILTNKMELHFIELPKLDKTAAPDANDKQACWIRLLSADTKEALNLLEKMNDTTMNKAVSVVRFMNEDDKVREQIRLKLKAEMDEAGLIRGERLEARAEGRAEGRVEGREELIKEMLADGVPEEQLRKYMKK